MAIGVPIIANFKTHAFRWQLVVPALEMFATAPVVVAEMTRVVVGLTTPLVELGQRLVQRNDHKLHNAMCRIMRSGARRR